MSIREAVVIQHGPQRVMEWFARPGAFSRLAPPWQPARLVRESLSLADGTAVLSLPLGLLWAARHQPSGYIEGRRFEDRSVVNGVRSAPMGLFPWVHEHGFEPTPPGHTLMTDTIHTPMPAAFLRPMIAYRQRQVAWDLERHAEAQRHEAVPLTVAVAMGDGATRGPRHGARESTVIGALEAFLSTGGHRVIRLAHSAEPGPNVRQWHPHAPTPGLLDGCDAVIAWGVDAEASALLVGQATSSGLRVAVIGAEVLPDAAVPGAAFASPSSGAQRAAQPHPQRDPGPRVVRVQAAPVLGTGLKERLLLRRGGAAQEPWIGLDDLVDIVHRCLWDTNLVGTLVAAAPGGLPDGRPDPALRSSGHRFRYPELRQALRHTLGRETEDQTPNAAG